MRDLTDPTVPITSNDVYELDSFVCGFSREDVERLANDEDTRIAVALVVYENGDCVGMSFDVRQLIAEIFAEAQNSAP